jgi:hypothetical protein
VDFFFFWCICHCDKRKRNCDTSSVFVFDGRTDKKNSFILVSFPSASSPLSCYRVVVDPLPFQVSSYTFLLAFPLCLVRSQGYLLPTSSSSSSSSEFLPPPTLLTYLSLLLLIFSFSSLPNLLARFLAIIWLVEPSLRFTTFTLRFQLRL